MNNFYRELTEEEKELNAALDLHREAHKDEKNVMSLAGILYIAGFALLLFDYNRLGLVVIVCALVCMAIGTVLQYRTSKHRANAGLLLNTYTRKKALPFYQELTEMFAEKPGVHLHLNDNGSITVTDKREEDK